MAETSPSVVVLAGPNGAGKSTIAQRALRTHLEVRHFVNADTIARGLSEFHSEEMALKAGKIMLAQLHDLAADHMSFAFETTLASRTFAPWLAELKKEGYVCRLYFVWVPSPEVSIQRVRDRVANGGHDIPIDTIRRRYQRGLQNFFRLYEPLLDYWAFYDNSTPRRPKKIASRDGTVIDVRNSALWQSIEASYR